LGPDRWRDTGAKMSDFPHQTAMIGSRKGRLTEYPGGLGAVSRAAKIIAGKIAISFI
jgi:hypothetical protein